MTPGTQKKQPVEPVPDGSGLLALPFLAAMAGLLQAESSRPFRVTLHRAMTRGNYRYLQQVTPYAESSSAMTTGVGRIFDVDLQLIGNAFTTRKVWRTKHYADRKRFEADLAADMKKSGERKAAGDPPVSWLAIPFIAPMGKPALVLFADSHEFNFFADDARLKRVVGVCSGFARLLDAMQMSPISSMRNFPLGPSNDMTGNKGAYATVHEQLDALPAPRLAQLNSFNFEIVGP